jgi:hypothetical protein
MRCRFLVAALVLTLANSADAAEAQKKKKKLQPGQALKLTGQLVDVTKDVNGGDKALGTITVKTLGQKGGDPTQTVVTITKDTTLETVPEPKKKGGGIIGTTPASFEALKKGERVIVHTRAGPGNQAAWVEIIAPKKKNVLP